MWNHVDRVLNQTLVKQYRKEGDAFYFVQSATHLGAKCLFIYKDEFGTIMKKLDDVLKMEVSSKEEFKHAYVALVARLNELSQWIE